MTAKAAIFTGAGQQIELCEVPIPELGVGEILVRVLACALCRSDLHTYAGRRTEPTPTILGHEIVGEILAFGASVEGDLEVGDRVTWAITASCYECDMCGAGIPQKCRKLFKYGHSTEPLSGGLATHVVLRRGSMVYRVPEGLTDAVACLASCSTSTAVAVVKAAGLVDGKRCLVFGAGLLGLTACALLSRGGASEVLVHDLDGRAIERAALFGATGPWDGQKVDVVLELSGALESVERGLSAVSIGGTIVLAGTALPVGAVAIDPERIVRRLIRIVGVHNYHPRDLEVAVGLLGDSRYPFGGLIASTYPLEDLEAAFRHAAEVGGRRVVVAMR